MEVAEVTELPKMSEGFELSPDDGLETVTATKKRSREEEPQGGFGESVDDERDESVKVAKYEEGETPNRGSTEVKEGDEKEVAQSAPKKSLLSSGIFDMGDDGDYENEVERERRLSYLTAMGAKQKKPDRLDEKMSFSAAMPSRSRADPSGSSGPKSRTAQDEFKSPSKAQPRTKMEKKEFVKDSVQSKITREAAPSIKPSTSKSLDFDALMARIAQRQTQIKLPTAEQVGLPTLANPEPDYDHFDPESVSVEEESDEISLEIDEEEEIEPIKINSSPAVPVRTAMPPPTLHNFQKRGKTLDMEEDEPMEVKEVVVAVRKSTALPSDDDDPLLLLDEVYVPNEAAEVPMVTQIVVSDESGPIAFPSQVSATPTLPIESSLQLEYSPTLPAAETSLTTPNGVKLRNPGDGTSKPSMLSTWLSSPTTASAKGAKRAAAATAKQGRAAKSTSSIPSSSPSSKTSSSVVAGTSRLVKGDAPGSKASGASRTEINFEDENAMTGEAMTSTHGAKENKVKVSKPKIPMKAKQLFDDEAETGFGSDAEQVDVLERGSASSDEEECGQSQDEYEAEVGGADDMNEANQKSGRFVNDIFETDDRAVIRSLQMKQELEREAAEAREAEQLILRRERRDRRVALELQSEARALQEAHQMEERLAQRRAQRSSTKGSRTLETSASLPVLPGRATGGGSDWLLDDSDEEDEVVGVQVSGGQKDGSKPKHLLLAAKRFEALAEQQQRRRLATSSQYLMQDEDSQSILQVIGRANQQSSRLSSDQGDGPDSPFASISHLGDLFHRDAEASQDSLGGWFDRPALASSSFSASSTEHLVKLKAHFKGNATQLQSSALLFQRSQDGFENSQDGFDSRASASPLSRSKSSLPAPKPK